MWDTHEAMLEHFEPIDIEEANTWPGTPRGYLDLLLREQRFGCRSKNCRNPIEAFLPCPMPDTICILFGYHSPSEDLCDPGRAYGLLMETLEKKTEQISFWKRLWGRF
jgi:hypothetical protein